MRTNGPDWSDAQLWDLCVPCISKRFVSNLFRLPESVLPITGTLSKDYGGFKHGDLKQFLFCHLSMPQVREFKIPRQPQRWKRRLEVYSPSFILYRDYSNRLTNFVKVGELSWGWSRAVTPHRKEMLRRTFIKEGDAWANSGLAFISSVLFTPLGEMISLIKYPLYSFPSTVFCVLGFNFYLSVVLDTEIWGS